ncbi:hypothetical protein [Fredinandcohnia sp. 179-A 10B2 NHS]|uniref:hypothetical protein n=1 Tax=Fredinandcohnia sp. 179-A 10B2 NHS TaxID=3235176 RepID=UPI00399F529C
MTKNKRNWVILILGSLLFISFGVGRIIEIKSNSEINLSKSEACMDAGGTVVWEQESLFSLTKVSCEK